MARTTFNVEGVEAAQRAFKRLEPKLAKRVIRKAARKSAKIFQAAIKAATPVRSGALLKSVRVRASKGTRSFPRGQIAIAVLFGEAGKKGDKEQGIRRPFYGFMVDHGFHVGGKRIRRGGKTVGCKAKKNRTVRYIPGKHVVKKALKSKENEAKAMLISEIASGIEAEAAKR